MSVTDVMGSAAGPVERKSSTVAQRFTALYAPKFDSVTNRTYQLVERDSDNVPHALSATGNHRGDAMIDALNSAKLLSWTREQIKAEKGPAADARREQIKADLKALLTVALERSDRVTRMLLLYTETETAPVAPSSAQQSSARG